MNAREQQEDQDAYDQASLKEKIAAVEAWVKKRDTIGESTVVSLAKQFKLSAKEVKVVIDRARYKLAANAEAYVDAHMLSVEMGLEIARDGGKSAAQGLKVAQDGAQWALERIGQGHSRVLDAPKAQGATGPQIVIGIQVGGIQAKNTVDPDVIDAESSVIVTPKSEAEAKPDVIVTPKTLTPSPDLTEPIRLDVKTATPLPSKKQKRQTKHEIQQKAIEKKVQAILAAVTKENAQVMLQSIMELGYEAGFAWEMIKAMLVVDEKI